MHRKEADSEAIECLKQTREVLSRLPDVTDSISCGFSAWVADELFDSITIPENSEIKLFSRTWGIDYTTLHYKRPFLSFFSCYCDHPPPSNIWDEDAQELHFNLFAGENQYVGEYNFDRWANEVGDLSVFLTPGRVLEIHADYEERSTEP